MSTQIANAAGEQSAVAAEIDKSITNIRQAAEENTEGSAHLVGQFKVKAPLNITLSKY